MRFILRNISAFIHIEFTKEENSQLPLGEIRRIRMVNYIGLISLANMLSYSGLYMYLDYNLFRPAIYFLFVSSFAIFISMYLNKAGFHNFGKFLVAILNPISMASTATWLFGKEPGFQTFLLLSAFIPLFLWSLKSKMWLILFLIFNYSLYLVIEFFPPVFKPLIFLPQVYISMFRSTNIIVCFLGAALAILFYTILAFKKEESLIKKTKELEDSQHHQDLVYSIIAHDLRNPFSGLLGLTSLLKQNLKDIEEDKLRKMVDATFETSRSLNSLLNNLLEWSKLKSGAHNVKIESINLYPIINEAIDLHREMSIEKNIELINDIPKNTLVLADDFMISTVVRNLITNAVKFTHQGGNVRIFANKTGDELQVCIEDNGTGISQKYLKNLFNLNSGFTKLGTNSERGSGLGLKLCGDFIEAIGGTIWAESKLNEGSRFYFTLKVSE